MLLHFSFFYGLVFCCIYMPYLCYPFICWWTFRSLYFTLLLLLLSSFTCIQLFVTLWTVAHQVPCLWDSPARILEWSAMPSSRGSSQPKDWTHISKSPALAARFFTTSTTWEAHSILQLHGNPLFLPHDQPVSRVSEWVSESCSVMSDSLQPHGIYNSWNSPVQNTRVGNLSLLQWIFPTQDWTMREALFLRYTHVISNLLF